MSSFGSALILTAQVHVVVSKSEASSVDPRFHRAQAAPEGLGRLLVREADNVTQEDRLAEGIRHPVEGVLDEGLPVALLAGIVGQGSVLPALRLIQEHDPGPIFFPECVAGVVQRHGIQHGSKSPLEPIPGQHVVDLDEDLLSDVQGQVVISHPALQGGGQARSVPFH